MSNSGKPHNYGAGLAQLVERLICDVKLQPARETVR